MKYVTLAAIAAFASLVSTAQPQLLSSEMMPFGSVVNMRNMQTFSAVDTSEQGAGATWDFTGLAADLGQAAFTLMVVDPTTTPQGGYFPTSNYAWRELPNNYYRYFSLTSSKMERVGSYTTSVKTYTDPQEEFVFPMTFGSSNTDTWETTTSDGTYDLECVGYGTLMLPGNTYDDVLMVRVRATELGFFLYWVYFWYSSDNGAILVQYIPDGFSASESGLFVQNFGIGIEENAPFAELVGTTVVNDELLLQFHAPAAAVEYAIVTASGAVAQEGRLAGAAQAGEVRGLDVSALSPSIYFLRLGDAGHMETLRFVKER